MKTAWTVWGCPEWACRAGACRPRCEGRGGAERCRRPPTLALPSPRRPSTKRWTGHGCKLALSPAPPWQTHLGPLPSAAAGRRIACIDPPAPDAAAELVGGDAGCGAVPAGDPGGEAEDMAAARSSHASCEGARAAFHVAAAAAARRAPDDCICGGDRALAGCPGGARGGRGRAAPPAPPHEAGSARSCAGRGGRAGAGRSGVVGRVRCSPSGTLPHLSASCTAHLAPRCRPPRRRRWRPWQSRWRRWCHRRRVARARQPALP